MPLRRKPLDPKKRTEVLAGIHRDRAAREKSYRDQALRLFPHVCAKCGREFSGKRLSELTVHHKDNNHTNNPPDGRNWELLCLYCHDDEHQAYERSGYSGGSGADTGDESSSGFRPFEGLADLLKPNENNSDSV